MIVFANVTGLWIPREIMFPSVRSIERLGYKRLLIKELDMPKSFSVVICCFAFLCVTSVQAQDRLLRDFFRDYCKLVPRAYSPDDPWTMGKILRTEVGHGGFFYNCDSEECKRNSPYINWHHQNTDPFVCRPILTDMSSSWPKSNAGLPGVRATSAVNRITNVDARSVLRWATSHRMTIRVTRKSLWSKRKSNNRSFRTLLPEAREMSESYRGLR